MSETSTIERDGVLKEFCSRRYPVLPWQTIRRLVAQDMADEIVRQRQRADRAERILAALREPSDQMVETAQAKLEEAQSFLAGSPLYFAIRKAVAAAEQEVDNA